MKRYREWVICSIVGAIAGLYGMAKLCEKELLKKEERAARNGQSVRTACEWIKMIQNGREIKDYFNTHGLDSVAVYGMGEIGKCLIQELQKSGIEIAYIIDKNPHRISDEYASYTPEETLPEVQAIIVTPSYDFKEISQNLKIGKGTAVICIDDIF